MKRFDISVLEKQAAEVRRDIISMSYHAKSAHMGGALSSVELLVALYFSVMRINPKKPEDPTRDRLIFSKAHDAKVLFSVLSRRGFFDPAILSGYEQNDGLLPGHSTRHCVPGVEVSAGALGHGLSMAVGVAWAVKYKTGEGSWFMVHGKKKSTTMNYELSTKNYPRVFAVISDGECDEGTTWEAGLFAGHHKLNNLCVIIDYNKLQGFGCTKDVLNLEPLADKWRAFGFEVKDIDGHSFSEIISATSSVHKKPLVIIAHTIKGRGGPKAHEGNISSQYIPPSTEEYVQSLKGTTI